MPPGLFRQVLGLLNGRDKVQKGRLQEGYWGRRGHRDRGGRWGHGDEAS